jgi:hypothetical protein
MSPSTPCIGDDLDIGLMREPQCNINGTRRASRLIGLGYMPTVVIRAIKNKLLVHQRSAFNLVNKALPRRRNEVNLAYAHNHDNA